MFSFLPFRLPSWAIGAAAAVGAVVLAWFKGRGDAQRDAALTKAERQVHAARVAMGAREEVRSASDDQLIRDVTRSP